MTDCSNKYKERPFAEFEVSDVSKPMLFIDSITGKKSDGWVAKLLGASPVNIETVVEGELDGKALVSFTPPLPRMRRISRILCH